MCGGQQHLQFEVMIQHAPPSALGRCGDLALCQIRHKAGSAASSHALPLRPPRIGHQRLEKKNRACYLKQNAAKFGLWCSFTTGTAYRNNFTIATIAKVVPEATTAGYHLFSLIIFEVAAFKLDISESILRSFISHSFCSFAVMCSPSC